MRITTTPSGATLLHECGRVVVSRSGEGMIEWLCPEHGVVAFRMDGGLFDLDAARDEPRRLRLARNIPEPGPS